jgi:TolB-like protein/Tfp pilus assembly protein PilF
MMHDRKIARGEEVSLRIGIHVGDVVERGNDILGDAVNIVSRIYPLAEPGGICVSQSVHEQVKNKFEFPLVSLGRRELKNVGEPVEVFRVEMPWEQMNVKATAAYPKDRVAILPFRSMSPDPNDEYFAEGMTEEIISTVSGISGLEVISRTSVMGYKGTTKKVKEIGRELEVGAVLEGSFRKAGNKIRVTTQLIDVAGDKHLWAQNYDRELDNVFAVQSDIAQRVAEALKVRILTAEKERIEKKPTENAAAYTLYLRGRSVWNKRGLEDMKKAMEYFELAVHEDPGFALGYAGMADCAILLRNNLKVDPEENLKKAKVMLEKALQLDPSLAEAHATYGNVLASEYDLRRAEEEFRRAIELKPSYATAHQWYAEVLRKNLRWEEALHEIERAVELDPLSGVIMENFGEYYFFKRDFAKAVEKFKIALELGFEGAHGSLAMAYGMMKKYDQMEKEVELYATSYARKLPRIHTNVDAARAYYTSDKETLRRLLPDIESHLEEVGMTEYGLACFYFFIDDVDRGFELLELAYTKKNTGLLDIKYDWDLDGVRNDPRYLDLLKRLGLD